MRKKIRYIAGLVILIIGVRYGFGKFKEFQEEKAHQEWLANAEHTATENVTILKDVIEIDYLKEKRSLGIYLPENYENDSVNYPVIYFMDGQSLFDQKILEGTEWRVDEVLDSIDNLYGKKCIVVGVYNSDENRLTEYKPFSSTKIYSDKVVSGDQHAEWIAKTLKPWIDKKYRTQINPKSTVIAGASLGGLMSYYMLQQYSEVFGAAIVFSPSYWVNPIVYELHKKNINFKDQKIYFNAGELETPTVESIEKMKGILIADGMPAENIKLDIEKELGHWHLTWRAGFPKAYPWIID